MNNKKLQKIRQRAKEKSLLRAKRKIEAQRRFDEGRKEHIRKTIRNSIVNEITNKSFSRGNWSGDKSSNSDDVLPKNKTVGFNKELFNDGKREP
jgi:hypothetical protein